MADQATFDHAPIGSQLDAIERVLRANTMPMTSRQLARSLQETGYVNLSGSTPWKTVNARLSEDILRGAERSRFMRVDHGLFALREWRDLSEFRVKRRQIAPKDEFIRVVPRDKFLGATRRLKGNVKQLPFTKLLSESTEMLRSDAEQTEAVVQLIPTFLIRRGGFVLTYKRTRRLPEARLHATTSALFGGHLTAEDMPPLFLHDMEMTRAFLFRELHEEVSFSTPPQCIDFLGVIYLTGTAFERQHAGLLFAVDLDEDTKAVSEEPGNHIALQYRCVECELRKGHLDSWSRTALKAVHATRGLEEPVS